MCRILQFSAKVIHFACSTTLYNRFFIVAFSFSHLSDSRAWHGILQLNLIQLVLTRLRLAKFHPQLKWYVVHVFHLTMHHRVSAARQSTNSDSTVTMTTAGVYMHICV